MLWGLPASVVGAGVGAVVSGTICVGSSLIFQGSLPTQGQLGGAIVSGAVSGGIVAGCASGDPTFIGAVAIGAAAGAAGAMTGTVVEKIVDQQPIHVGEVLINGGLGAIGGGIGGGIGHHLAGATAGGTLTITTGTGFTLSPGGVIAVQATTATVSIREAILATSQATAMAGAAGLSNLIHMTATGGPDPAREMAEKEAASVAPNKVAGKQTFRDILTPAEQAEFEALQAKHPDWMPKQGLDSPATVRSVAENAAARSEFTGRGHHRHPLKFGGEPNPPDLVPTGETGTRKNPTHTEITNWWNKVLRRITAEGSGE
jgi:hypothetical protein